MFKLTVWVSIATKQEVEDHFKTHGTGVITEIKLMNGFGFIEYEDAMDARDVVPGMCTAVSNSYQQWLANLHVHHRSFSYVSQPLTLSSNAAIY